MNQTPVYQFPLAEDCDVHSMALVNSGAQRLEEVLLAIVAAQNRADEALQGGQSALEQSLTAAKSQLEQALAAAQSSLQQALEQKSQMAVGSYLGDGADSRAIVLGFQPRLVVVCNQEGIIRDGNYTYGGIAIAGKPTEGVEITSQGFLVKNNGQSVFCNYSSSSYSRPYIYYAFS